MKIKVEIDGNTATEKWFNAKVACQQAINNAIKRIEEVRTKHKEGCGQLVNLFSVPDGKHFVDAKFFLYNGRFVLDVKHPDFTNNINLQLPITKHWDCKLITIIEFTVALNCWQPTIEV